MVAETLKKNARRIAAKQGISEAYVDQILMPLRAGGLLVSRRGRSGGYLLGRPAEEITVLDIVEVLEGRLSLVACTEEPSSCERADTCVAHIVWARLSTVIRETLSEITLAELEEKTLELNQVTDYVI